LNKKTEGKIILVWVNERYSAVTNLRLNLSFYMLAQSG